MTPRSDGADRSVPAAFLPGACRVPAACRPRAGRGACRVPAGVPAERQPRRSRTVTVPGERHVTYSRVPPSASVPPRNVYASPGR